MARDNKNFSHKAGTLKQSNKTHKCGKHRSKTEIKKGKKVSINPVCFSGKSKKISKKNRRALKKLAQCEKQLEACLTNGGFIGKATFNPHVVTIVSINSIGIFESLKKICNDKNLKFCESNLYKKQFTDYKNNNCIFVCAESNSFFKILDATKCSDSVLLLFDSKAILTERNKALISMIFSNGVKNLLWVCENEKLTSKGMVKRGYSRWVSNGSKVCSIASQESCKILLRSILNKNGNSQSRFDKDRGRLLIEGCFVSESKQIVVHGYVGGKSIDPNQIIYVPNVGSFNICKIETVSKETDEGFKSLVGIYDEELRQKLPDFEFRPVVDEDCQSVNSMDDIDQRMAQLDEIFEDKIESVKIPPGTGQYQAAWFDHGDCKVDAVKYLEEQGLNGVPVNENMENGYTNLFSRQADKSVSEASLSTTYIKPKRSASESGDDVEVPMDYPACKRFTKYRGWKQEEKNYWKADENLPAEFSQLYHFNDVTKAKSRILSTDCIGALAGWYIELTLDVDSSNENFENIFNQLKNSYIAYALLEYENKMSMVNFKLSWHPNVKNVHIFSKDSFIFQVGFKRFKCNPIFSEDSDMSRSAHKYNRKISNETKTFMATTYCPIIFSDSPIPVLMFRVSAGGVYELLCTGTQFSINPYRICLKKCTLTGNPLKINKRHAIIRNMFYSRDDVMWFKPVELLTKQGRRGVIKEAVGTHGNMKCVFDAQLASNDLVYLHLYKRQFPKWTYSENVPPPTLYRYAIESSNSKPHVAPLVVQDMTD